MFSRPAVGARRSPGGSPSRGCNIHPAETAVAESTVPTAAPTDAMQRADTAPACGARPPAEGMVRGVGFSTLTAVSRAGQT